MVGHVFRITLPTLAVALLGFGNLTAGDDNQLLEEVRKRQAVAAQAMELEVQTALAEANRLKNEPLKAVGVLKKVLQKVENDTSLSIVQRASLRSTLNERIKLFEDGKARAAAEAAEKEAAELNRKLAELKKLREDNETVRRELDIVASLRQQGKLAEANQLAAEIARKYPNNLPATQQQQVTGVGGALREAQDIRDQKGVAFNRSINEVARSSIPEPGDISYPKNWAELSKKRLAKYGEIEMSAKEREIVQALNEIIPTPTRIEGETLEKVLEMLQKTLGQPLLVNKAALKDLDITYERTISVNLPKNISKRSLLRGILADLGLTYVIRNEAIEVLDPERAKNALVTRVYRIDDLVGPPGSGPLGFLGGNQKPAHELLIDMIQDQIEPLSWAKNNGPGTITYYPPQRALIIRNTAEVINMIGGRSR